MKRHLVLIIGLIWLTGCSLFTSPPPTTQPIDDTRNPDIPWSEPDEGTGPIVPAVSSMVASPAATIASTIYYAANGKDSNSGDMTHPKLTFAPKSGSTLILKRGDIFNQVLRLDNLTDITVKDYGSGNKPVIKAPDGTNCTTWWYNTARITISNIRFTSNFTLTKTAGGYVYHKAKGSFGNVRGDQIKLLNIELEDLGEGVVLDATNHVTIDGLAQIGTLGISARCVMVMDAANCTITNCTFLNSVNESPLRATSSKGFSGTTTITHNTISQVIDVAHGRTTNGNGQVKAAVTIRQASGDFTFLANKVGPGNLSVNTDDTGLQTITRGNFSSNIITNAQLEVRPGSVGCSYTYNTITAPVDPVTKHSATPCVAMSAGLISSNIFTGNQMYGDNYGGIKFFAASNAILSQNVLHSSRAGVPCITGDVSVLKDIGGNVTKVEN